MAATPSSLTTASSLTKQHYLKPDVIQNVMIEAGPWITGLLSRADTGCGGSNIPFPIITGSGGGVGSNYGVNQLNTLPGTSNSFLLTRGTTFGIGQIGGEIMEASQNPDDAFIRNLTFETDTKLRRVMQIMAQYSYSDGTGTMGRISTGQTLASSTLVLDDITTVFKFAIGDSIRISAAVGGATRNAGAIGYVVGINQIGTNQGQLIVSSSPGGAPTNINTIWAAAAQGDFIYMAGDDTTPANVGGSGPAVPQGVLAWCPPGGPQGGDNFFSVNRFNNSFLYGQVIDCTSNSLNVGSIREALTVAVTQLHQVSGRPTKIFLNPLAYYKLSLSLQSQGLYSPPSGDGEFGFTSLSLPTPHGPIKVVMDPMCCPFLNPATFPVANGYNSAMTAFVLEEDTWEAVGKGEIPHLDEVDIGNYFLRLNTVDAYQYQYKAYWQVGSHAPNHNAVVMLPQ